MSEVTESIHDLLSVVGLAENYRNDSLNLLENSTTRYVKDLKLNFTSVLTSNHLSEKESALLALSVAVNNQNELLIKFFEKQALSKGATADEMSDAVVCASLLTLNNILYRFRHFTEKEKYAKMPAGVRMQAMSNPVVGKEFFELMSIAISAINGCELCVNSHEKSIINLGATEERVFDAIRIASVVASAGKIIY